MVKKVQGGFQVNEQKLKQLSEDNKSIDIPELHQPKNILGKWSSFFINRYKIAYLILLIIIILGITSYINIPRELQPEVIIPYSQVLIPYPGATPEEVESLITEKVENNLSGIEDLKAISSFSSVGASMIWLEFNQKTDMDKRISDIREKVNAIISELPDDAQDPIIEKIESNSGPIMIVNLSGDFSQSELKYYAEKIKDKLEAKSNISEVVVIGGLEREIKVTINPEKLAVYGINPSMLKQIIQASNLNFPGGTIKFDEKNYNIRTVGEIKDIEQIKNIVIGQNASNPLKIKDIATVEKSYKEVKSYSRMAVGLHSDNPHMQTSVALAIKKTKEADIIKTSSMVMDFLDENKGILFPEKTNISISGDLAEYIREELGTVTENANSGLFLVLVVLFLFIGLREATIVSIVIPLAIYMTLFFLNKLNMTLNTITLFSLVLAVGMLVDNGIVIMENVDRLRMKGLSATVAAETGANQIAPAVMASTLTTLAAFFPIALTPGIMGEFIKGIPITVMIALLSSFFLAVTLTPVLCSRFLKGNRMDDEVLSELPKNKIWIYHTKKIASILFIVILSLVAFKNNDGYGILSFIFAGLFGGLMFLKVYITKSDTHEHPIINKYAKILDKVIKKRIHRWTFIILLLVAFGASLSLIPMGILPIEMFSGQDNTRLYIDIETPDGSTIDKTTDVVKQIEQKLYKYEEIKSFVSNIGITGADSFDTFSMSSASGTPNIARITLDLVDEEDRSISSQEFSTILHDEVQDIAGATIEIVEIESGPPSGNAISIGIIGENLEKMNLVTDKYKEILSSIEGTIDISTSLNEGGPELQVQIDKEKAARYGLNDFMVGQAIRDYISGVKLTTLKINKQEIDVMLYHTTSDMKTKDDLKNMYFYTPDGRPIRFGQIASFTQTNISPTIRHEDSQRRINLMAQTKEGYNTNKIMQEFIQKTKNITLPDGISIKYAGEMGDTQESFSDMFINMIVAAILVYIILVAQFNSLTQPLIILFAVPLGLIGVMPGLVLTGNSFNFVAFIGVVALVGIAVNDAIVLVDYINYLRSNGYNLHDAVIQTGKTRFMPVMATTITTAGGILPLTLKEEFFASMGYSLIFGLMMSTILTLVAVPTLYTMLESFKHKKSLKKKTAQIMS